MALKEYPTKETVTKETGDSLFYLASLKSVDNLKEIVIERFNYNPSQIRDFYLDNASAELVNKISSSEVIAECAGFQIVYFQLNENQKNENQSIDQFIRQIQTQIIKAIDSAYRTNKLYVFSDSKGDYWHFVAVEQAGKGLKLRRFAIDPDNRNQLRTACEQLDILTIKLTDTTLPKIRSQLNEAFSVEEVSTKFFKDYKKVFDEIKGIPG